MALSARQLELVRRYAARLEAAVGIDEDALVAAFLTAAGRNSVFTADAYRRDFAAFRCVLTARGVGLLDATPEDVDAFGAELDARRPRLAAATINRALYVVRAAYRDFADRHPELELRNPVLRRHLRRRARRLPRPVSAAVIEVLLAGITTPRDRALVAMYLATGLRLRALLALNVGDLVFQEVAVDGQKEFCGSIVARDKGGHERQVYFTSDAWGALEPYLRSRRAIHESSPLFTNARGTRLSARGAEQRLTYWCRTLHLPPLQVHQLRHTFATTLLQRGMPLERLQLLLGHRQITTTLTYTAIADTEMQAAYVHATSHHRRQKE